MIIGLMDDYAFCNRCVHYEGNHSSIFGECWTCAIKGNHLVADVSENDWYHSEKEFNRITHCPYYIFGENTSVCLG